MMLKIILVISFLFSDSLNQNKIDLIINHYSKINFLESDFELVTYQSKKEKFRNNGVIQVEKSNFKILIDDVVYAHYDNKFYTISSANKELTILNIENNERITDESILFKINPLSFLKKFRENNNIVFEETNNRYIIRYKLEQEKYNLFFEKNFDLANIEIIYKNSEISNKIFFSKTRNVNTERNIKIDLHDVRLSECGGYIENVKIDGSFDHENILKDLKIVSVDGAFSEKSPKLPKVSAILKKLGNELTTSLFTSAKLNS